MSSSRSYIHLLSRSADAVQSSAGQCSAVQCRAAVRLPGQSSLTRKQPASSRVRGPPRLLQQLLVFNVYSARTKPAVFCLVCCLRRTNPECDWHSRQVGNIVRVISGDPEHSRRPSEKVIVGVNHQLDLRSCWKMRLFIFSPFSFIRQRHTSISTGIHVGRTVSLTGCKVLIIASIWSIRGAAG